MDFTFTDEQEALRDLARQIFRDQVSHERLCELEAGSYFDDDLWADLCRANLTGLGMPEDVGGSGLTIFEIGVVLEELGRQLAPVPLFPSLVLGGQPIAEFGSAEQRERWLAPAAT